MSNSSSEEPTPETLVAAIREAIDLSLRIDNKQLGRKQRARRVAAWTDANPRPKLELVLELLEERQRLEVEVDR